MPSSKGRKFQFSAPQEIDISTPSFKQVSLGKTDGKVARFIGGVLEKIGEIAYQEDKFPTLTQIYFDLNTSISSELVLGSIKQLFDETANPELLLKTIFDEGVEKTDKAPMAVGARAIWSWRSNLLALINMAFSKFSAAAFSGKNSINFRVSAQEGLPVGSGIISGNFKNDSIKCEVSCFDTTHGTNNTQNIRSHLEKLRVGSSLLCRVSDGKEANGFFFTKNKEGKLLSIRTEGSNTIDPNLVTALTELGATQPVPFDCLPLKYNGDCTVYVEMATYFIMKAAEIRGCSAGEIIEGLLNKTIEIDHIVSIEMPSWTRQHSADRATFFRLLVALKGTLEKAIDRFYDKNPQKKTLWKTALDEQLPFPKNLFKRSLAESSGHSLMQTQSFKPPENRPSGNGNPLVSPTGTRKTTILSEHFLDDSGSPLQQNPENVSQLEPPGEAPQNRPNILVRFLKGCVSIPWGLLVRIWSWFWRGEGQ